MMFAHLKRILITRAERRLRLFPRRRHCPAPPQARMLMPVPAPTTATCGAAFSSAAASTTVPPYRDYLKPDFFNGIRT